MTIQEAIETITDAEMDIFKPLRNKIAELESEKFDQSKESTELAAQLLEAQERIGELEGMIETPPTLEEMIYRNGELKIELRHPFAVQAMAASFMDTLGEAPNYAEAHLTDTKTRTPLTVTVQKVSGKTPHQLRIEAESERDKARERVKELEGHLRDAIPLAESGLAYHCSCFDRTCPACTLVLANMKAALKGGDE